MIFTLKLRGFYTLAGFGGALVGWEFGYHWNPGMCGMCGGGAWTTAVPQAMALTPISASDAPKPWDHSLITNSSTGFLEKTGCVYVNADAAAQQGLVNLPSTTRHSGCHQLPRCRCPFRPSPFHIVNTTCISAGPTSLMIFPLLFRFEENLFCSHPYSNKLIAKALCTWPGCCAVMACEKIIEVSIRTGGAWDSHRSNSNEF